MAGAGGFLGVLSGPQRVFAQGLADKLTATKAYCLAFPDAKPEHAAKNTTRLKKNEEIKAEVKRIRAKQDEKLAEEFVFSKKEWLESFLRISEKAEETGDYSAARGALREIGLAMPKWYAPEKLEVTGGAVINVTIGA